MQDFRSPEDLFREHKDKIKNASGDLSRYLPLGIVVIIILLLLQGVLYTIGPEEVGVVQRFGRKVRITQPGLHAKFPLGIEKVSPVRIRNVYKEEFGFRTLRPGVRTVYSPRAHEEESIMLTGDLNILDVQWIVQFRIQDPVKFLFETREPLENLRAASEVVIRRLVGNYSVDEVLTEMRPEVASEAEGLLQELMDQYGTGINVLTIRLLDVNPPREVRDAFNEVNEARQDRERMINEAWQAYNKVIPQARGEAERTIQDAEGYRLERVNRAAGDAERFVLTWEAYRKAPEVTKKRLYLETMTRVIPKADRKYLIDPSQPSVLPLLQLDKDGGLKQ